MHANRFVVAASYRSC